MYTRYKVNKTNVELDMYMMFKVSETLVELNIT